MNASFELGRAFPWMSNATFLEAALYYELFGKSFQSAILLKGSALVGANTSVKKTT